MLAGFVGRLISSIVHVYWLKGYPPLNITWSSHTIVVLFLWPWIIKLSTVVDKHFVERDGGNIKNVYTQI